MRQHEPVELDAFGLDRAIDQRMGAVIITAGDRQLQCHSTPHVANYEETKRTKGPSPFPLPQVDEGQKETHIWSAASENSPRPFRWERTRVRAFSVSERKSMKTLCVEKFFTPTWRPIFPKSFRAIPGLSAIRLENCPSIRTASLRR